MIVNKTNINKYEANDPGLIVFPRKDVELEVPAEVGQNCMVYVGTGMRGRKVKVLLMREEENSR